MNIYFYNMLGCREVQSQCPTPKQAFYIHMYTQTYICMFIYIYMFYHLYLWVIFIFLDDPYWIVSFHSVSIQTSRVSWSFEDDYFPEKTRIESFPNPYEIFLPSVWFSPLWMSCHFSFSRSFSFQIKHLVILMVSIVFLLLWQQEKTLVDFIQNTSILQYVSAAVVPFSLALRKFNVNKALCNLFLGAFSTPFCCLIYPL